MLREYWERTTMVERVGSYYGKGFKGGRGATQGYPLSPTILMWWWMRWYITG